MSQSREKSTTSGVTRRSFLQIGIALTGAFALDTELRAGSLPAQAPAVMQADTFASLSGFLTGKTQLDTTLAARALTQLRALDPGFDGKLSALSEAIAVSRAKTMDDFLATEAGARNRATATTIVSAWYLGYTGTPDLSKMADASRFVTYREALMFAPTLDVSIIPTFSRGKNGFWHEPPATLATD
ncbi:putative Fructose 5-dehydrogenase [Paraburkholderia tropica]|uniref:sorbitol dehydrogenase family protein n=1 Tax=Paraburkholderia tropica TaxID=92647 RepID=UPI001CAE1F2A|nr:sorbitol dehydrogenase family protein [Paraburkholderia tropica]CAG9193089.1 putative Fructose 5-dehydrogenase [Paraburkholderia tropica]